MKSWEELPKYMRNKDVKSYYLHLTKKEDSIRLKRIFDIVASGLMLCFMLPLMILISIIIVLDSKGGVFFRQERITQYGRKFKIYKFRTMVKNAESYGTQITSKDDERITSVGLFLRKYRIDEIPQLINIFLGDMTFVGTRPEVVKYVKKYSPEMMATLLLPSGVTSETSIKFKNEENLLVGEDDIDKAYVDKVLPEKMKYNLKYIKSFSVKNDIKTIFHTVYSVFLKK